MQAESQDLKLIKAVQNIFSDYNFLTQSCHLTPEILLHMDHFYDTFTMFFSPFTFHTLKRVCSPYHLLCSTAKAKSYRFKTPQGWVNNNRIYMLGENVPLKS